VRPQQRDRSNVASGRRDPSAEVDVVAGALLTAEQVAQLLGVPRTWVYEQSRSGRIPTVTLGRYRRYRREAIEAWVRELEQTTPPAARTLGHVRQ
jgi:excisionase family DNA binding protein